VQVLWPRTLAEPDEDSFRSRIKGQHFEMVGRRGKYLIFHLSEDVMLVHLRMTGDLVVEPAGDPFHQHHRLVLGLDDGMRLAFNDARKFGRVWLLTDPEAVLAKLGPEPLDSDFSPEQLYQRLQARRRLLKPLLMDQAFIAGLGNIYVDEALFESRLHPLMTSDDVSREEARRLWLAIRRVLEEGIRRNGASIDWAYRGGEFQNQFQVYGRKGEGCYRCGAAVERLVVGQRGTHICPQCQQKP
jgi:formamidopyrimidine-DNA glycosylase